ncbi:MAG: uracil-DNA glycosylase [Deltaproteobacteria bacterium]|nr:uracil-DNA glycosylase [Deltaproteobacteria bacterium]
MSYQRKNTASKQPSCYVCSYYYVTWTSSHPHGCKALGFKSKYLPCLEVSRASGKPCQYFEPKKAK